MDFCRLLKLYWIVELECVYAFWATEWIFTQSLLNISAVKYRAALEVVLGCSGESHDRICPSFNPQILIRTRLSQKHETLLVFVALNSLDSIVHQSDKKYLVICFASYGDFVQLWSLFFHRMKQRERWETNIDPMSNLTVGMQRHRSFWENRWQWTKNIVA